MNDDKIQKAINDIRALNEYDERKEKEEYQRKLEDQIDELSCHEPIVRTCVIQERIGNMTHEQALMNMVIELARIKKDLESRLIIAIHSSAKSMFE